METLVTRPQTVEEIAEDNLKYKHLKEKKEEVICFCTPEKNIESLLLCALFRKVICSLILCQDSAARVLAAQAMAVTNVPHCGGCL